MTKPKSSSPKRSGQKGAALFFALIFILILSVLSVSIMFTSQAETWSSLNYLEMTQARYGAEAGLNSAADYIVNTYCAPGNTTCSNGSSPASGDVATLYNTNVSPVTLVSNGSVVTLSTTTGSATYPVSSVETAFRNAALGSITSANRTVNYTGTATLVSMNQVTTAAGAATVETWNITANGAISTGARSAQEQVTGVVEQQVIFGAVSAPNYAVFATANTCDAINISNGITIGSYNSTAALSGGNIVINKYGGNVGSNGNLTAAGGATINGTLSTPRTGVSTSGSCSSSNPNALDYNNGAAVTECSTAAPVSPATTCSANPVQLSQSVTYSTPTMSAAPTFSSTGITVTSSSTCSNLGISSGCSGSTGNLTIASTGWPAAGFGPLNVNNGGQLTLSGAGTLTINSITIAGGGTFTVTPTAALTVNTNSINLSNGDVTTLNNTSPITVNVYGTAGIDLQGGTALALSGTKTVTMNVASTVTQPFNSANGSFTNATSSGIPTPADFLINYSGTSAITLAGGAHTGAAVYAPNAPITLSNGTTWYGSIIGSTLTDSGGASVYYDLNMGSSSGGTAIATVQQSMMDSFSWTRF